MKKVKITIQGMHCASCAGNVEKSLKKIPGVKEASVSLMMKKGSVEFDDDAKISEEESSKDFPTTFSRSWIWRNLSRLNGIIP